MFEVQAENFDFKLMRVIINLQTDKENYDVLC